MIGVFSRKQKIQKYSPTNVFEGYRQRGEIERYSMGVYSHTEE